MIAAASFSSASWISSRLSKRIRSLPKPANHLCSYITDRCLPSRALISMPRLVIRPMMPRCLRWVRHRLKSAYSLAGLLRGRPGNLQSQESHPCTSRTSQSHACSHRRPRSQEECPRHLRRCVVWSLACFCTLGWAPFPGAWGLGLGARYRGAINAGPPPIDLVMFTQASQHAWCNCSQAQAALQSRRR